jgi:hypothetical protein
MDMAIWLHDGLYDLPDVGDSEAISIIFLASFPAPKQNPRLSWRDKGMTLGCSKGQVLERTSRVVLVWSPSDAISSDRSICLYWLDNHAIPRWNSYGNVE